MLCSDLGFTSLSSKYVFSEKKLIANADNTQTTVTKLVILRNFIGNTLMFVCLFSVYFALSRNHFALSGFFSIWQGLRIINDFLTCNIIKVMVFSVVDY